MGATPLVRRLAIFALASGIGVSALGLALPWQPELETTRPSTLHYTASWLRGEAHADSWIPMRRALELLDRPGRRTLYERIWFRQRMKFQYPPSSLLAVDGLGRIPGVDGSGDATLNAISRLALLATALVVARILVLARRRALPAGAPGPGDGGWLALLALLLSLCFYPLLRGYYLGQIQTWIDLLVALLVLAFMTRRRALAGALAGLVCAIKPPLALLLLWAGLRREWRFAAGLAATAGLLLSLSVWLYGLENHLDYARLLRTISRQGESYYPNQSANGLLHRALGNGPNLGWSPHRFAPYHGAVFAGTLLSGALLVGAALFRGRTRDGDRLADLLFAIWSFTLASPVVWDHHYGIALPLFAAALPASLAAARGRALPVGLLALAWLLVANDFPDVHALASTPWNALQSFTFFGGLLLLAQLYWLRSSAERPAA